MSSEYVRFPARAAWRDRENLLRRIAEEAYRAARYRLPFTLLLVSLDFCNQGTDRDLKEFTGTGLRELDFAGKLGEGAYAIGMPNSPCKGAEVVANRLRRILIDYRPRTGVAGVPEGGVNPSELLATAAKNLN
ncbi:MAG TPA: hypothetical protein VFS30_12240 [Dehalococcoidia bacterium]|nr:hypothetical protein [Dehalococcoidia bacterium]